jgi:hypothetical protein
MRVSYTDYDLPRGAITALPASCRHPWPDICRAVLKERLPAYVVDGGDMSWRLAPAQFASLSDKRPFDLDPTFAGPLVKEFGTEFRTTEGNTVRGHLFFFESDFEAVFGAESEEASKRGRKPAINWDMVDAEVFRLMDYHGPFSRDDPTWNAQARLEKEITKFISEKWGREKAPEKTAIRKHVSEALRKRALIGR